MKWVFSVILCFAIFSSLLTAGAVSVSAEGAVLINGATGQVLWGKNADKPLSMASTTKIMTALLLCENADLSEEIIATEEMVTVEGSSMGLLPGDRVDYRDLLYGMLLASGNDAANTVALSLAGSADKFAALMNKKAAEIGMANTHFVTASGLDAAGHYSTAHDMALLARYALENPAFKAAAAAKYATLEYGNPPYRRTLKNHNKLLWNYEGAIGVKTGYTKKSGRCLVSAAVRDGEYLIAVTLNAPSDWSDHAAMLDYGFSLISPRAVSGERYNLAVVGGAAESVSVESAPIILSLSNEEYKALKKRVILPRFVYAGVEKGKTLGRVELLNGDKVLASMPLVAAKGVKPAPNEGAVYKIFSNFKKLFKAMV